MSAQRLRPTETRTETPPAERTTQRVDERPATARAPLTFRVGDTRRLQNLFDACNAVLVDPAAHLED